MNVADATTETRTCSPAALETLVAGILRGAQTPPDIASEVARHLVRSNLSGHDSHGVIRVPQYVGRIETGELKPAARPQIVRDGGAASLFDADYGFGHVAGRLATEWVIRRAAEQGIAIAAIRHCTHTGRLGEYGEMIAEAGMIAVVTVGAAGPGTGGMVLPGSSQRFFGANPWAFAMPTDTTQPVLVDASSSAIAEGKVRVARESGTQLPPDAVVDAGGHATRNPEDFYAGGALLPLGGAVAGHKGYGFALASALLAAVAMVEDPTPSMIGASVQEALADEPGHAAGFAVIAIDPGAFGSRDAYARLVGDVVRSIHRAPSADSARLPVVPGEPELGNRNARRDGLSLPTSLHSDLTSLAHKFELQVPEQW